MKRQEGIDTQRGETPPEIQAEVEKMMDIYQQHHARELSKFGGGTGGHLSSVPDTTTKPDNTDAKPPKDKDPNPPQK